MGKIKDKIMNAFSLNEDDYDDEYDDEYDEEFDGDDYNEEEEVEEKRGLFGKKRASAPKEKEQPQFAYAQSNVRRQQQQQQEVCIFKPSSIEDSREITEMLLQGKAVVINFEGLHVELSQRIIDFISGSCYALDGNLQKISNYIFIATPHSVDISGDFQDLVNGSADITGFKSPLI